MSANSPRRGKMVFLYGPSGSGKTVVGQVLAERLGYGLVNLDAEIEKKSGKSVPEIFEQDGEARFRQIEGEALSEWVERGGNRVISLGGGALLDEKNLNVARSAGEIICLDAPLETLAHRLEHDPSVRPLLQADLRIHLKDLLENRKTHYASFPYRVDTGELTPQEAAWKIMVLLGRFHAEHSSLAAYDILIARDGYDRLAEVTDLASVLGPCFLVSDRNVFPHYGEGVLQVFRDAGLSVKPVLLEPGESSKQIEMLVYLWEEFLEGGIDRTSLVVALGGGVVGDLAGFAAATILRGVRWGVLPTSLLSMVDSGFGGKTGINLPQGKNLAGAFHFPQFVLINPDVLSTLPQSEWVNGLAEVVKHGVIGAPDLFELCAGGFSCVEENLDQVISQAVAVKCRIIQEDPLEKGVRKALNFGHTIGHGVEKASNERLRHGDAVAIGMVAETKLAVNLGLADPELVERLQRCLENLGLPVRIPAFVQRGAVIDAMSYDKKKVGRQIQFCLPAAIGDVRVGISVEPAMVEEVIIHA